tara:strand:+ start:182 stop:616 length:435 start_codon:yes stop_codon:yes gene_type:complete
VLFQKRFGVFVGIDTLTVAASDTVSAFRDDEELGGNAYLFEPGVKRFGVGEGDGGVSIAVDEEDGRIVFSCKGDGRNIGDDFLIHLDRWRSRFVSEELTVGGMTVTDLSEQAPGGGAGEADCAAGSRGVMLDGILRLRISRVIV